MPAYPQLAHPCGVSYLDTRAVTNALYGSYGQGGSNGQPADQGYLNVGEGGEATYAGAPQWGSGTGGGGGQGEWSGNQQEPSFKRTGFQKDGESSFRTQSVYRSNPIQSQVNSPQRRRRVAPVHRMMHAPFGNTAGFREQPTQKNTFFALSIWVVLRCQATCVLCVSCSILAPSELAQTRASVLCLSTD